MTIGKVMDVFESAPAVTLPRPVTLVDEFKFRDHNQNALIQFLFVGPRIWYTYHATSMAE